MELDFDQVLVEMRKELLVPTHTPEIVAPEPPPVREETWKAIVQAVGRGMTLARACALQGASLAHVKRVLKDPARARELQRAKASLIDDMMSVVVGAATGDGDERGPDWRAAAWVLPKIAPELQDKKKPTVSITNQTLNVGDAQQVKGMTTEELRKFLGA